MDNRKTKKSIKSVSVFSVVCCCVLVFYCVIMFTMVFWAITSSMKGVWDFDDNPIGLPEKWLVLENYKYVFKNFVFNRNGIKANIWQMFSNSLLYAAGCATASVLCCSMMAYVCSKFSNYKLSKIIYAIVIFTMIFPIIGSAPSEMQLVTKLGFKNHLWAMWIMKFNFLGLYFLVLYASFNSVPKSYSEAAKIDGANNYQIMLKIYYPLIMPIITTIWLLYFISFWNDYQTPLLYMPKKPTIAYGLYDFYSDNSKDAPYKLVACTIVLIPILALFLAFKDKLMGKLSLEGGVKG